MPARTGPGVVGLDVGTSSVKAACVELRPGAERPVVVLALRRRPTPRGADELVAVARVPLDERGRALKPLLTWDGDRAASVRLGVLDPGG